MGDEFTHILRVLNTNVDGKQKVRAAGARTEQPCDTSCIQQLACRLPAARMQFAGCTQPQQLTHTFMHSI